MKLIPRDFFLNIASMAALYVSVISFVTLLFEYIDTLFPKEIGGFRDPYSSGISFALASLIIIFPLYLYFTRVLNKDLRQHPEKRDLGIRRWLIYMTLFVAAVTIVIDLIILLHTFFSGQELTSGFVLKVLAVLVIIGAVFWYYFQDIKRKWEQEEKLSKTIASVVAVLVLAVVVGGFFIMGSPQAQRLLRVDMQKISDLQNIQWQIVNFWQQKEQLPNSLDGLSDPLVDFTTPTDPQSGEPYEYRVIGTRSFELCAVFNRESPDARVTQARLLSVERSLPPDAINENWIHGEGRSCFERTIDPDRFPSVKGRIQ